ncbi:MAG: NUDIX hydrolase [Alphaproteobacteria bacterium]|nr:NUDIX hydrolase [Alphaproteobacteria bacterium]
MDEQDKAKPPAKTPPKPNVSVRAVIVKDNKLLVVNGDGAGDFWCTPGGRLDYGEDLKTGIAREVFEETGLSVSVGDAFAVSEFVLESNTFHNVDIFFRCEVVGGEITADWKDTGGPVVDRCFVSLEELQTMNIFPRWLRDGRWQALPTGTIYFGMDKKS